MKSKRAAHTNHATTSSPTVTEKDVEVPADEEHTMIPGAVVVAGVGTNINAAIRDDDEYLHFHESINSPSMAKQSSDVLVEAHIVPDKKKLDVFEAKVVRLTVNRKLVLCGLVTLVVVVAILVPVLVTQNRSNPSQPTNAPANNSAVLSLSDLEGILTNFTNVNLTAPGSNVTAQGQAVRWLASQKLSVTTPRSIILDGFVLAAFYYATGGPYWNNSYNFLSGQDVCAWSDQEYLGVSCISNGVDSLTICETEIMGKIMQY
jgi:hypothetical protein